MRKIGFLLAYLIELKKHLGIERWKRSLSLKPISNNLNKICLLLPRCDIRINIAFLFIMRPMVSTWYLSNRLLDTLYNVHEFLSPCGCLHFIFHSHTLSKTIIMCSNLSISLKPNNFVYIGNFLMLWIPQTKDTGTFVGEAFLIGSRIFCSLISWKFSFSYYWSEIKWRLNIILIIFISSSLPLH